MNIYLEALNLNCLGFCQGYSWKSSAFILTLEMPDYHLLINGLLCLAVIIMFTFLVLMAKSLRTLKASAKENKQNGKVWINSKLYDFDADQLKTLIKKINKSDKNDKQVETKN